MRTKYIGFVKTSFSSPSLPFRIGGYAPGKNSQFPSFTHPPRTSTLRSRRIQKGAKLHSEKANTRTKRNVSSRHFRGSFPALSRFSSLPKKGVHGCAKSRIKSWEETLNISHLFSFSLRLFPKTTPPIDRFLEEEPPRTFKDRANFLANETTPDHSYAKTHDDTAYRCRFCAQPIAKLTCVSPTLSVSFAHKKTATHLPMDSCQKRCGR